MPGSTWIPKFKNGDFTVVYHQENGGFNCFNHDVFMRFKQPMIEPMKDLFWLGFKERESPALNGSLH